MIRIKNQEQLQQLNHHQLVYWILLKFINGENKHNTLLYALTGKKSFLIILRLTPDIKNNLLPLLKTTPSLG